ncbi:hypothetical protein [Salipiger abyssi]|uniref:hypothetical protein n=1 Tax=Salipiger abyssi TaxID=1250539 RepID=UPI001A8DB5CF|nr:hypothetical protein [Salipiger abyssi]MBN9886635.1 hypothetical protein [Salipiger abyssi]
MMNVPDQPYAGLILPASTGFDIQKALGAAAAALKRLDTASGRPILRSNKRSAIMADRFGIDISAHDESSSARHVAIRLIARQRGRLEGELVATILAQTVLAILEYCRVDRIEWFSPDTVIGSEDFIRLHTYVSPRRKRLAPLEDEEEFALSESVRKAMAQQGIEPAPVTAYTRKGTMVGKAVETVRDRIAEQPPEERRLKFAGWLMTGLLGLMSFPIASALVVIGLGRGMDFRLATQALTMTSLFVTLQNADLLDMSVTGLLN